MLTGIGFRNYKAFKEGHLEIKPITILLGANSVGKTSLIQLFLMLQETALAEHYKSALKLYGGFFSLGEGINLFRKKIHTNNLGITIEFNDPSLLKYFRLEINERFTEEVLNYCYFLLSQFSKSVEDTKFIEENFKIDRRDKRGIHDLRFYRPGKTKTKIDKKSFIEIVNKAHEMASNLKDKSILKDLPSFFFTSRGSESILGSIINSKEEIFTTYDLLNRLSDFKEDDLVKIEYDFSYSDGVLKIKKFNIRIGDVEQISLDFDKINDVRNFISCSNFDLTKVNQKHLINLKNAFDNTKTVFSFVKKDEFLETQSSVFNTFFIHIISFLIDKVEEAFHTQSINYVSPIRAYPKRYYFLDKAKTNIFLDTLDGEAIAEILKENSKLKDNVNSWFKKFNLHIDVGQLKDIIHQIVVKQNSLDLDLTDVGFGVSQVLPVIIQGFLSKERSITLIEQPEIHLHPKMQADLADLFIDIAIKKSKKSINKFLIIETHSEYLLKRLRRRISENQISSEQVGIYYIEPQDQDEGAIIRKIEIDKKGAFDWPKDFYSGDLAADVTEFLKNQI